MNGTMADYLPGLIRGRKSAEESIRQYLSADAQKFFAELIELKKRTQDLKPEELVKRVDWSRLEGPVMFTEATRGASDLSDTWKRLTDSEKILSVTNPQKALIVKADQERTDVHVQRVYGSHRDGTRSNAFRHALWNALMTRDIGRVWSEAFATAHEDWPEAQLRAQSWEGFSGLEHKAMDLHNNAKGRECVRWYDFFVSDETLSSRVEEKIRNREMKILVS
ncbi:MAG: hypothetical protein JXB05_02750 [Myxococcaceae bacterium]|nr:hypothetical protein [Myxococcaceae bacterium]